MTSQILIGLAAAIPSVGLVGYVGWRQSMPVRATKVVRTLYDQSGKRPQQPRLRRVLWSRQGWVLAWKMPVGADSAEWQANSDKVSEPLRASVRIAYDDGLVWMRLGSRRIPNKVSYRRFYRSRRPAGELVIGIGQSQEGRIWTDLARLPHLLVVGQNGSGKSIFLHQLIIYLSETHSQQQLRMTMVDLKGLGAPELRKFRDLPHVDGPVVASLEAARDVLLELQEEMNARFKLISEADCSDFEEYNRKNPAIPLPRKVVVIDEFADLTQGLSGPEGKLLERVIRQVRAGGIHFVIATQRSDANVVPGQIRNNMGAVLGFRVGNRQASEAALGDGRSACMSLPKSPGIAVWQLEQGAEVRVRVVGIERDEARERVQLQRQIVLGSLAPPPRGELPASDAPILPEGAQRLALPPSRSMGDDEHRPLSVVWQALGDSYHAVIGRVAGTRLPVTSRISTRWQNDGHD